MQSTDDSKIPLGRELARRIENHCVIGVGSGRTVAAALVAIGQRLKRERLQVSAVAASMEAEDSCQQNGIRLLKSIPVELDWAFDGADEIDPQLNLLKGRGGALFRERMVASAARRMVIVADESKLVPALGTTRALPVEIIPEACQPVIAALRKLGATDVAIRHGDGKDGPVITEYGNLLADCRFGGQPLPPSDAIRLIPGVADCGLFEALASEVLIPKHDGIWSGVRQPTGDITWARLPEP